MVKDEDAYCAVPIPKKKSPGKPGDFLERFADACA